MPDSHDKDQVETFTPAMCGTHYCASPPLQRSKLDLYHAYFITGDLDVMQGEPNYV